MTGEFQPQDEELFRYLEGELDAERAVAFDRWSRTSEGDARIADARALLAALAHPEEEPRDLVPAIAARLQRPRRWRFAVPATAALAAAVALLVWSGPSEFRTKGTNTSADAWSGIELYRLPQNGTVERVAEAVNANDALLVAYRNGGATPYSHLAVFGVDADGKIAWYFPAWTNPNEDPESIAILPSTAPVELHERITHALAKGRLVVHAIFSRRPLRVSELERLIADSKDPLTPLPVPDAAQQRVVVEVK